MSKTVHAQIASACGRLPAILAAVVGGFALAMSPIGTAVIDIAADNEQQAPRHRVLAVVDATVLTGKDDTPHDTPHDTSTRSQATAVGGTTILRSVQSTTRSRSHATEVLFGAGHGGHPHGSNVSPVADEQPHDFQAIPGQPATTPAPSGGLALQIEVDTGNGDKDSASNGNGNGNGGGRHGGKGGHAATLNLNAGGSGGILSAPGGDAGPTRKASRARRTGTAKLSTARANSPASPTATSPGTA